MKRIGKIMWTIGIIGFFVGVVLMNNFFQNLLQNQFFIDFGSNITINTVGYNVFLISIIVLLFSLFPLIIYWMKSGEEIVQENLTEEEKIKLNEGIELISTIKSNIPFSIVRAFMSSLLFLGILSVTFPFEGSFLSILIQLLLLIFIGLIAAYFILIVINQFRAINEIENSLKENEQKKQ